MVARRKARGGCFARPAAPSFRPPRSTYSSWQPGSLDTSLALDLDAIGAGTRVPGDAVFDGMGDHTTTGAASRRAAAVAADEIGYKEEDWALHRSGEADAWRAVQAEAEHYSE